MLGRKMGPNQSKEKFTIENPEQELIDEARKYLGEAEIPMGSNRSIRIDYWNLEAIGDWRSFPMGGQGAPWCGSFVTGAGRQALGHLWPVPVTGVVQAMVDWAKTEGIWSETGPEVGDLFCLYYPKLKRYGHVGIVTEVSPGEIKTIEGNTNDGGSRTGFAVFERIRKISNRMGFIKWSKN